MAIAVPLLRHIGIMEAQGAAWSTTMAERMRPKGRPLPRLLALREERLLTQEELGAMAGVQRSTIARIELGGVARFSTIKALALALDVQPAALLGHAERERA